MRSSNKLLRVSDIKNAHGGIFTFNGFMYLCSYNSKVYEIASLGDKGWIYYDQPKESHIDNECEVFTLMINAKMIES
jgi:hypothetical protein